MTQVPFNHFSGSGLGSVPKGWVAVADVYARIALDFFNQLGPDGAERTHLSNLAGAPPDRHDAHDTPFFLTWRVLSYCSQVATLEPDGGVKQLRDRKALEPRDEWASANAHINLAEGRLGTGVDRLNSPHKETEMAALGYANKQPILVLERHVNRGRSEVLHERHRQGRPEKGPEAVLVYRRIFPNGHKVDGLTNEMAATDVSKEMGTPVTWKTIKRHL